MARGKKQEITDYDSNETGAWIDPSKPLRFEDIGLRLPETSPTQVVSIRLPTKLLNQLRALGSERDVPYQALIKLFLDAGVKKMR
ncbi:MAG: hypothetical protein HYW49_09850 [Deltaproteobacteria bacterium]|nr:hypothetical protein [Deltaproteobacteria bacterium]